ncbi:MAG: hypothetical protein ACOYJV_09280 [Aminivibrio sp.]|jgi:hypothetical protein
MRGKNLEIAHLRQLLIEAYSQLEAVQWEINIGVMAKIEQYFADRGIPLD